MLSQPFQKPLIRDTAFFIVLCIGMWIVGWDSTLTKLQSEPHLWRQSDCISLTEYYAKGNGFFEPEMHCRISDHGTSGKTVAEFPIIYYIIGKIWSVTGTQLWIFRLFNALFGIIALTCLYRTLLRLTNGCWLWSALGPLLVLASPVYAFYGIGFLTNVPAFNCTLIAWHFICRYYYKQQTKQLLWASFFFALSGLLKISAMTSYVLLLFLFAVEAVGWMKLRRETQSDGTIVKGKMFGGKAWIAALILLAPALISVLWQLGFVEPYCNLHGGRYSFTSPVPIWENTPAERKHIWDVFLRYTAHQIYPGYIWFFFLAAMTYLFIRFRKVHPFWLIAMPAVLIGHAAFSCLFFFCLDGHDYYHADVLLFFVLVYAALIKHLRTQEEAMMNSRFTKFIAILCMWYALLSCGTNLHLRFFGSWGQEAYSQQFMNRSELDFFEHFSEEMYFKRPYVRIGNELTKRGFSDTVPVIAINDVSFNSMLIMVGRPGFTNISDKFSDSATTALRIQLGAQILLVEDPQLETRGVSAFMDYELFSAGHIGVYDLRPYAELLKKP